MGRVAGEMNLSETAFVEARPEAGVFDLRWFTPRVEVDLCGHATLAAAHVLWESGSDQTELHFETRSGRLTAIRRGEWIELNFPADVSKPIVMPHELEPALRAKPVHVRRGRDDLLVEVESAEAVRQVHPNFDKLAALADVRGVIVTAASDDDRYDFVSRFFAPGAGINEDPVTGSAHCALGAYWAEKLHDDDLVGYQASPRGGVVRVRVDGDRVRLSGQAVTILRGELMA
jgi:PhzF family phenazine biosynthesis protein